MIGDSRAERAWVGISGVLVGVSTYDGHLGSRRGSDATTTKGRHGPREADP
jgi:hypothetical protein